MKRKRPSLEWEPGHWSVISLWLETNSSYTPVIKGDAWPMGRHSIKPCFHELNLPLFNLPVNLPPDHQNFQSIERNRIDSYISGIISFVINVSTPGVTSKLISNI